MGEEAKYRAIVSQERCRAVVTIVGLDHASAAEQTRLLFAHRINFPFAPLPFDCVNTVSEPHLFEPWNLQLERKQLPRFVGNVDS